MGFFVFARRKNFDNPQLLLVTLLTLTVVTSLVASGWVGGAILYGQEFVQQVLIPFILVSGLLSTVGRQYFVFLVVIAASLLMVANGYVQVSNEDGIGMLGNPVIREGSVSRISYLGYLSDPNDLGMFFTMTLPCVFLLKERVPSVVRPLLWGAILALLYGIYLTNSRGTLLATMALMAFWFWRKYGTNKSFMLGLVSSPALLIVLTSFRTISADDESSQGRLEAWYAGYQMFASNPIFGVGQHNFMDYYELHTAHNSFVLVMSELGLIGALAWVGLLVVTTVSLINISEKKFLTDDMTIDSKTLLQIDQEALIAKSLLYSFIAFMVTGFFLSRTYTPLLYIYLGMAAACLGRVGQLLPKGVEVFNVKKVAKYTFAVTIASIFAIYLLLKVFL
tara:strand:+ start:142 stop:1320 length:1179 start_codon:yes stop_codon:yes gene_type:complete